MYRRTSLFYNILLHRFSLVGYEKSIFDCKWKTKCGSERSLHTWNATFDRKISRYCLSTFYGSCHWINKIFERNKCDVFGGKLLDFWWRVEFQCQGSPHLRIIVWFENHPSFDSEEGLRRIDKICSCELSSEKSDLHELVMKCQVHRHSITCKKNNTTCRFSFSRQMCWNQNYCSFISWFYSEWGSNMFFEAS